MIKNKEEYERIINEIKQFDNTKDYRNNPLLQDLNRYQSVKVEEFAEEINNNTLVNLMIETADILDIYYESYQRLQTGNLVRSAKEVFESGSQFQGIIDNTYNQSRSDYFIVHLLTGMSMLMHYIETGTLDQEAISLMNVISAQKQASLITIMEQLENWNQLVYIDRGEGTSNKSKHFVAYKANQFEIDLAKIYIREVEIKKKTLADSKPFLQKLFVTMPHHLSSINEITYEFMLQHAKNYYDEVNKVLKNRKKKGLCYSAVFSRFYYAVLKEYPEYVNDSLKKLDIDSLLSVNFVNYFINGYEFIIYNPYVPRPEGDRWKVRVPAKRRRNSSDDINIDFSIIRNPMLKELVKDFVYDDIDKRAKYGKDYKKFVARLSKMDEQLEINYSRLSTEDCYQINRYFKNNCVPAAYEKTCGMILRMIEFAAENGKIEISSMAKRLLLPNCYQKKNVAAPNNFIEEVGIDTLRRIIRIYKEKAESDYTAMMSYGILALVAETGFRPSSICCLKIDALQVIAEKNGYKEYSMKIKDKTNRDMEQMFPVSNRAAELFNEVLKATAQIREECSDKDMKEYLFIFRNRLGKYGVYAARNISKRLIHLGDDLGRVRPSHFRKYAIDRQIEYAEEKNLSDIEIKNLAAHRKIDTLRRNYDFVSKSKESLELLYEAEVNELLVKGEIRKKASRESRYRSEANLGYCSLEECDKSSYEPCLLCKSFVTSVDEEQNFRNEIAKVDEDIRNETMEHERDFLQRYKEILVSYLYEIYRMKGEIVIE